MAITVMHAVFKDGKQRCKAHSTRLACIIELFELGVVLDGFADMPGQKDSRFIPPNFEIRKIVGK